MKSSALLEETGLIEPVGEWILHTACAQAKRWLDDGLPPLRMSVNLSARQFNQADLARRIQRILADRLTRRSAGLTWN